MTSTLAEGSSIVYVSKDIQTSFLDNQTSSSTTNLPNKLHVPMSSYHALTCQLINQHELHQVFIHQNHTYLQTIQHDHATQLSTSLHELEIRLPQHILMAVTQELIGMSPMGRFKVCPPSLYQHHNTYQPLEESQYNNTARQATTMPPLCHGSTVLPKVSSDDDRYGREDHGDAAIWIPEVAHYLHTASTYQDASAWGQDLAGVGSQFYIFQLSIAADFVYE